MRNTPHAKNRRHTNIDVLDATLRAHEAPLQLASAPRGCCTSLVLFGDREQPGDIGWHRVLPKRTESSVHDDRPSVFPAMMLSQPQTTTNSQAGLRTTGRPGGPA